MSILDRKKATDAAKENLQNELANTDASTNRNRFVVSMSDIIYKCTFGKCGTPKPKQGDCTFTEDV